MSSKVLIVSFLAAMLATVLSACSTQAESLTPTSTPEPVEVTVTLTDFKIETSQTSFELGKTYRFVVTNKGMLNHEFMVLPPVEDATTVATEEAGGMGMGGENDNQVTSHGGMTMNEMDAMALAMIDQADLPPGATKTIEVTFDKPAAPGELELACHTPGHYPAGMKQAIEVTQ